MLNLALQRLEDLNDSNNKRKIILVSGIVLISIYSGVMIGATIWLAQN